MNRHSGHLPEALKFPKRRVHHLSRIGWPGQKTAPQTSGRGSEFNWGGYDIELDAGSVKK